MWDADTAWPRGYALFSPIILYICGRGTIAAEMHVHRSLAPGGDEIAPVDDF